MSGGSERFIEGLVDDLAPVRPVRRLRLQAAALAGVVGALVAIVLGAEAVAHGLSRHAGDAVYALVGIGLALAAVGASLGVLAAARPGREALANRGAAISVVGWVGAIGACVIAAVGLGHDAASPPGADQMCFESGVMLAIVPALAVFVLVSRGFATRPRATAALALAAAGAIGASLVQLSCELVTPLHLLVGHATIPVALAVVGAIPLGMALGWWRDRA